MPFLKWELSVAYPNIQVHHSPEGHRSWPLRVELAHCRKWRSSVCTLPSEGEKSCSCCLLTGSFKQKQKSELEISSRQNKRGSVSDKATPRERMDERLLPVGKEQTYTGHNLTHKCHFIVFLRCIDIHLMLNYPFFKVEYNTRSVTLIVLFTPWKQTGSSTVVEDLGRKTDFTDLCCFI